MTEHSSLLHTVERYQSNIFVTILFYNFKLFLIIFVLEPLNSVCHQLEWVWIVVALQTSRICKFGYQQHFRPVEYASLDSGSTLDQYNLQVWILVALQTSRICKFGYQQHLKPVEYASLDISCTLDQQNMQVWILVALQTSLDIGSTLDQQNMQVWI